MQARSGLFLKFWGSIKLRGGIWVGWRSCVVDTEKLNIRNWRKEFPPDSNTMLQVTKIALGLALDRLLA